MSVNRPTILEAGTQHVLDYLKWMQADNPAFFYAVEGDDERRDGSIFWADATARMNYSYFGDAVILNTTYLTSGYRVPFASLTGLNHHGQPVLFGSALVLTESQSSFIWLLQTWLLAMSGRPPLSITIDTHGLIKFDVANVLPAARCHICKSRIFRKTQEKLVHIYRTHPTFELEFKRCIIETETIHEFEACWALLLESFDLTENPWLFSMYNICHQWVLAYMRDSFFGDLSLPENPEGLDAFFSGYINASTTMQVLLKQYEKAVSSWHEKELKADYDTANSTRVLKMPSPMEKQAAGLYTGWGFMKFQGELVETLANPAIKIEDLGTVSTYRVLKFGEDHKTYTVSFNTFETSQVQLPNV